MQVLIHLIPIHQNWLYSKTRAQILISNSFKKLRKACLNFDESEFEQIAVSANRIQWIYCTSFDSSNLMNLPSLKLDQCLITKTGWFAQSKCWWVCGSREWENDFCSWKWAEPFCWKMTKGSWVLILYIRNAIFGDLQYRINKKHLHSINKVHKWFLCYLALRWVKWVKWNKWVQRMNGMKGMIAVQRPKVRWLVFIQFGKNGSNNR